MKRFPWVAAGDSGRLPHASSNAVSGKVAVAVVIRIKSVVSRLGVEHTVPRGDQSGCYETSVLACDVAPVSAGRGGNRTMMSSMMNRSVKRKCLFHGAL